MRSSPTTRRRDSEEQPRRRVLIVAPQPFYEDRGTPIAVRQVIDALLQLGHEVDLLTFPVGEPLERAGLRIIRTSNPLGVRRVPIGFSLRKVALDVSLARALRTLLATEQYECVHAVEEAAFLAVRMASPRGLPVIYDMQSSLPEQLRKHIVFRVPPLGTFAAAAERWLLRRVDVVVASAGLAERVRLVAPDTQYHEWRFASPLARASADDAAALRRTLGIAPDAPVVLYSGTFESYQGLPELLDAIPMVLAEEPDAVFVLVGANGSDAAEVARRASGAVPVRALRLIQRQPREAMPGYLAMADVLVSPRKHGRNLPLKIFDYLAAERPIVATDIPTHRSILDADRALLVEPTGAALASGIAGVLRDPERARALAAGAQAYARRHLDWMAFVGSVEEIYAEALRRE